MEGSNLSVMAWRNLWRNRRRTLLTLSSIAFGVFLAVIFTAMQDQNWVDMIDLAARLGGGHVTLQHPEYLDTPTLTRTLQKTDKLIKITLQEKYVKQVVQRIRGHTMLSTARESYGAGFIAFDPMVEDESTISIIEALVKGEPFASADAKGIIIGERLARNLGADMNSKIVYTMTDKNGEIVSGLARVSGIIRTGAPTVDGGLCLLPIGAVREVLSYTPHEAIQVAVFIDDQRRSDKVANRLQERIGKQIAALPWYETQPDLAGFISMKIGGARFMEILIAILVAAGIFNTLFVSVMERLREFGIMIAIGLSPSNLFKLVMLESLWLGLVGLVAAVVITAGPYFYLVSTGIDISAIMGEGTTEIAGVGIGSVVEVGIFPENAVIIAVAALIATLLAGLYPALRAGRVEPVNTINLV